MKPVLRIEQDGDSVTLQSLVPERLRYHGFGTLLHKTKPGEISITKSALAAILAQPYRSGLQGLEIFSDFVPNVLAWKSFETSLVVPLQNVSFHEHCSWFKNCCVVEEEFDHAEDSP